MSTEVEDLRFRLEALGVDYVHARRQAREEALSLHLAEQAVVDATAARDLIQAAAHAVQEEAHSRLALVVTRCLKAVFGDEAYSFKIRFDRKRGRTEAHLILERDGLELDDPLGQAGGGVIDVAALGLRLACLLTSIPRLRRLLVLDEPLKHLSAQYRPAAREMLEALVKELGMQILMVTHSSELRCGKVIEL